MNRQRHFRVMVRIGLPAAAAAAVMALGACSSLSGYATAGGGRALASNSLFPPPPPVLSDKATASADDNAAVNRVLAGLLMTLTKLAADIEGSRQRLAELQVEVDSTRAQIERLLERERPDPGIFPAAAPASEEGGNNLPFVRIRFGQPKVDYVDALNKAVQKALAQLPDAEFDIVAIAPLESYGPDTAERRAAKVHAKEVVATFMQMGVPPGQLTLSSAIDSAADVNEVRIYIR